MRTPLGKKSIIEEVCEFTLSEEAASMRPLESAQFAMPARRIKQNVNVNQNAKCNPKKLEIKRTTKRAQKPISHTEKLNMGSMNVFCLLNRIQAIQNLYSQSV